MICCDRGTHARNRRATFCRQMCPTQCRSAALQVRDNICEVTPYGGSSGYARSASIFPLLPQTSRTFLSMPSHSKPFESSVMLWYFTYEPDAFRLRQLPRIV